MSEIKRTVEQRPTWLKVLVFGPPGTGKTVSPSTFPGRKLYLDFDQGVLSLRTAPNCDYVRFQSLDMYERFELPQNDYEVVVLDSLTSFGDRCLEHVLKVNKKFDPMATITQPEWGAQQRLITDGMSRLLALPCHVVVTAHQHLEKEEVTGRGLGLPLVTGKLAQRAPLWFDEVYHTVVEPTKEGTRQFLFQTSTDGLFYAKSRLNLPARIPQDFTAVLDTLNANPQKGG